MYPTPLDNKPRRLEIRWLDDAWGGTEVRVTSRGGAAGWMGPDASLMGGLRGCRGGQRSARPTYTLPAKSERGRWKSPRRLGFTVIEMLVVIAIIGFLAAMALPHLSGMTSANTMTLATQQLLNDVGLARQLAVSHRTTVYMVFASPTLTIPPAPINEQTAYNNVSNHQYSAYALVSLRSVGDQPGASFPQYLTAWKTLPDGIFFPTYKFNATAPTPVVTTNTFSGTTNGFLINAFANIKSPTVAFPFPAADALTVNTTPSLVALPYVAFTSSGQLASLPNDEVIPLARGSVFTFPTGAQANELPTGNSINNPTLIHIDALTGRAKIERNQF